MRKLHSKLDEFSQILEESADADRAPNRMDYGMSGRDLGLIVLLLTGSVVYDLGNEIKLHPGSDRS